MYSDYEFYKIDYFGELVSESDYPKYELRARNELDYYTLNKTQSYDDSKNTVKMCQCKLIDLMYEYDQEIKKIKEYENKMIQGVVASETVGKQSVSYQKVTLRDIKTVEEELNTKIAMTIQKGLIMTGLLYRGVLHVQ